MTREEKIQALREQKKKARIRKLNRIYLCILAVELIMGGLIFAGFKKLDKKQKENEKPVVPESMLVVNEGDLAAIYVEAIPALAGADVKIDIPPVSATITCIGDIMIHEWQIERSYDAATDSFDVSDSFEYIKKYLSTADLTMGNLETTLAGRYNGAMTGVLGYSGYPMFNAPECLADTLKDCGVDFLQTANNHSLDSWEDGIYLTIDYLDKVGLMHTGTFKTKEENEELCIIEINGITFGFVAYTYGTNGLPVPDDAPYCVNTLDNYRDDLLEEMYQKVRDLDAEEVDFVCPMIHFGTEYTETPDWWQEKVVDGLFDAGADIILGGHPHVIEPIDVRKITNPDGTTRTGYVVYSFGNFVSSQVFDGVNKDLGIIVDFEFTKETVDGVSNAYVSAIKVEPTYVYWTSTTIGVVPVLEAYNHPDDYAFLSAKDWNRINFAKDHVIELLMSYGNLEYTIDGDKFDITVKPEFYQQ